MQTVRQRQQRQVSKGDTQFTERSARRRSGEAEKRITATSLRVVWRARPCTSCSAVFLIGFFIKLFSLSPLCLHGFARFSIPFFLHFAIWHRSRFAQRWKRIETAINAFFSSQRRMQSIYTASGAPECACVRSFSVKRSAAHKCTARL